MDARIRTLVENCVKLRQRGMLVLIGDKGREQVVNLHYMLSKAQVKARPTVLWCYKKDLYLSRCVCACMGPGGGAWVMTTPSSTSSPSSSSSLSLSSS